MNIGIFTDAYYPQINGVVTSTRALEKELAKMGHTIYVFTASDPRIKETEKNIYRIASLPLFFLPAFRIAGMFSPKAFRIVKKYKLDVIHTQTEFSLGIFGKAVAKVLKIPLVHTYHTLYEDYVHYIARGKIITPKMAKDYSRIFCNSSMAVITPTEKSKKLLTDYGTHRPIHVIPTGLNLDPFSKSNFLPEDIIKLRARYGIAADAPVVVFVGRIAKEKSIDVIVRAMPGLLQKMPNAKFVAVGGGPMRGELEALAEELGISDSVIFTGEQPWDTIGAFYHLGDVFVSASVTETQGLTYIEAMAAEVPVIAKKDESISGLIVDGHNGRLFVNDDELPQILHEVLSDKKQAQIYALRGLASIQPFSAKEFARSVEQLYLSVVSEYNAKHKKSSLIGGSRR